jgi:very-short-patch-repair endonuclease
MNADWRAHYNTDFVQGHIQRALDAQRSYTLGSLAYGIGQLKPESPLEAAFAAWWHVVEMLQSHNFGLLAQYEVDGGRYRLDFAVVEYYVQNIPEPRIKVAVELDGHDFHERTREQVDTRNIRDRYLGDAGWTVCISLVLSSITRGTASTTSFEQPIARVRGQTKWLEVD